MKDYIKACKLLNERLCIEKQSPTIKDLAALLNKDSNIDNLFNYGKKVRN